MKEERKITIQGQTHVVVISDEYEALLAAAADGRAIIGIWDRKRNDQDLSPAVYLVENPADIDEVFLEQVVRRTQGLPWRIGETDRLVIREFCMEDIPCVRKEEADRAADGIFYTPDALRGYIKHQYAFYQYGIWALVEKETGVLVGKAGVSHGSPWEEGGYLELGYHIFEPYRRRGYAREACNEIQSYVKRTWDCGLYAKIDTSNEASIRLIRSCGFHIKGKRYNEEGQCCFLYAWNC